MKHQAINLVKFKALCKRLGCPMCHAVGYLETMWIFAQINARDGDLSRFSNLEIAAWIEFPGDPDLFVDALVETRWLDRDGDSLSVHDWDEHRPTWLKGIAARKPSREPSRPPSREPSSTLSAGPSRPPSTELPNLTQPNLTQPNLTQGERASGCAGPRRGDGGFEDWIFPDGWESPELREALDGFAAMRNRIGKPVASRTSTSKVFRQFESAEHLRRAAEFCEANEYQGLKPEYGREPKSAARPSRKAMSLEDILPPITDGSSL